MMNAFKVMEGVLEKNFNSDTEKVSFNEKLNSIIQDQLERIEENDEGYVEHEKKRLITAVVALFIGLANSNQEENTKRKNEVNQLVNQIAASSISIVEKKRLERLLAIPPEKDEVIALMNDMEYEYWDFFIALAECLLNDDGLSDNEKTYLETMKQECVEKSNHLDNLTLECLHSAGILTLKK
jgi:hypothetical protein